ncbi:hypothetical protein MGYG_05177 [Nannizzia gypsea CBS 118893]|uniref:Uncharacterized protein n=1 Tax=Arthroderma gypseum (strain ATCC MYA-4604 / CBS 118893) TaxID=535722 RepID=E4UYL1_ARTGP|nr:hypothetical protein MGYG_05177 [Nannizzia gypsea CBS 118893]EFR02174.1 hypothetical protein MGYG_05177 [Nannizzia gypsea CBS 118893]
MAYQVIFLSTDQFPTLWHNFILQVSNPGGLLCPGAEDQAMTRAGQPPEDIREAVSKAQLEACGELGLVFRTVITSSRRQATQSMRVKSIFIVVLTPRFASSLIRLFRPQHMQGGPQQNNRSGFSIDQTRYRLSTVYCADLHAVPAGLSLETSSVVLAGSLPRLTSYLDIVSAVWLSQQHITILQPHVSRFLG